MEQGSLSLTVRDAAVDLLLGGRCAGCARPGRLLCRTCAAGLPGTPGPAWPTPAPTGLAPPFAAAGYDGVVRALLLGHKEHRLWGLRAPLAGLLAPAVLAAAAAPSCADLHATVLVPVPSRAATVRARGHDPTYELTARAAALLRRGGGEVVCLRMLRHRRGVLDQAGLSARARVENLAGSLHCPAAAVRRLARRSPRARVVVCDDVITTGATAREAQRALESVGLLVVGIAAVAATRRRALPPTDLSLPTVSG